jgi:hypothetical protein
MASVFVVPWIFGLILFYFLSGEARRYIQIFTDIILSSICYVVEFMLTQIML